MIQKTTVLLIALLFVMAPITQAQDQEPAATEQEPDPAMIEFSNKIRRRVTTRIVNFYQVPHAYIPKSETTIKLYAKFVIDTTGKMTDIRIAPTENCLACDKELVRVLYDMPRFKPFRKDGELRSVWFALPVRLELR